jgi:hypothetical protein
MSMKLSFQTVSFTYRYWRLRAAERCNRMSL